MRITFFLKDIVCQGRKWKQAPQKCQKLLSKNLLISQAIRKNCTGIIRPQIALSHERIQLTSGRRIWETRQQQQIGDFGNQQNGSREVRTSIASSCLRKIHPLGRTLLQSYKLNHVLICSYWVKTTFRTNRTKWGDQTEGTYRDQTGGVTRRSSMWPFDGVKSLWILILS